MFRLVVLALALSVSLGAQGVPPTESPANAVRLDVHVTPGGPDEPDLSVGDVQLLEDGVAQPIDAVEKVDGVSTPHTFVVFLDTLHLTLDDSTRRALVRLVDRTASEKDRLALTTPEAPASSLVFGPKADVLSAIMRDEAIPGGPGPSRSVTGKEALYTACYPPDGETAGVAEEMAARRRERLALDALDALATRLRGDTDARASVLVVTEGWRVFRENRALGARVRAPARPGSAPRPDQGRRPATSVMLTECEADRAALARLNDSQRLRDVVERANRATVTFYPVHRLALTGPADAPSLRGAARAGAGDAAARLDSLQQLAADTDGVALLRAADTEMLVDRLEDDLRSYYLIRYRSTNGRLDGRFRTITVRVLRQGMDVRTRRGYRGLTPNDLVAESTASARASGPESAAVLDARAPFRTRTSVWSAPDGDGTASVWLVGELDYALRKELVWTAGARARIQVVGVDGAEIAASELSVPAADGSFSFRLPESGGLPPGEYAVRVELQPVSGAAAPLIATVRLVVPRNATVFGEAVLSRRGPSTGLRHAMTADVRFQRNERIRVEMPTGVEGVATARMLDRLGNPMQVPVQVSMREDSTGLFRWVVADAVLAPLARGEYAIEVSLAGARDSVAFSVVP